jgi:uncharacterized protein (DUF58 family)
MTSQPAAPSPADQRTGQWRHVQWRLSRHAQRLLTLAFAGLLIALVTGRPAFAGLAAPPLLLLAAWREQRPASVRLSASLGQRQLTEGQAGAVTAELGGLDGHEADLRIAAAEAIEAGPVGADGAGGYRLEYRPVRWGRRRVGTLEVLLTDSMHLAEGYLRLELPMIDCQPMPAMPSGRIVLSRLPSRLGEHPARVAGEGSEFTGVREFVPGDRQRRINWPATTRRGTLQLNTFAAERAQNVVIIADVTADVGVPGLTSLDLTVRGAAGLIASYQAARDRIGLIVHAGTLSWIAPGLGQRHGYRLLDLLMSSGGGWDRTAGLTRLPRAALPPGALIIVLSPLLDYRLVESLRDLRERGLTVLVIDVLNAEPDPGRSRNGELTRRLWRLEQRAIRFSLTQLGIPVLHWDGKQSLDEPLAPYTQRTMLVRRG